jgi:hypothetical protein
MARFGIPERCPEEEEQPERIRYIGSRSGRPWSQGSGSALAFNSEGSRRPTTRREPATQQNKLGLGQYLGSSPFTAQLVFL